MHPTQPLKWQEYCRNPNVKRLLTSEEIMLDLVNREAEAEAAYVQPDAPVLPDTRKHPMMISETFKRTFSFDMIRAALP